MRPEYTPDQLVASMSRAREMWERSRGRKKRTMDETSALKHALVVLTALEQPMSVRSCFYRAESFGAVTKDEDAAKVIDRALVDLRKIGKVPYDFITDGTRHVMEEPTWDGPGAAGRAMEQWYRRPIWSDQPVDLWVSSEKDAIIGTVAPVLNEFTVPCAVRRGYSSLSLQWQVCRRISRDKKTIFIDLGDHDASGVDAWRSWQETMSTMLDGDELAGNSSLVSYERIAVTPEQITEMGLHTRPPKVKDSRHKGWVAAEREAGRAAGAVEVDAIPPNDLRRIVRDAVLDRLDLDALEQTRQQEQEDLRRLARARELLESKWWWLGYPGI